MDEGLLGLQLHGREQMKVQFKDIRVTQFTESFQDALLQGVRYHKVLLLMPSQEPGEAP